jgi:hypothetical protein
MSIVYCSPGECSSSVQMASQCIQKSWSGLSGEAYKAGHEGSVRDAVKAVVGVTTRSRGSFDVP